MTDKAYDVIAAFIRAKTAGIYVQLTEESIEFNGIDLYTVEQMNAFIDGFKSGKRK